MKEFQFQPLQDLDPVDVAYVVDLDARLDLETSMVPSSLTNLPCIVCPIEIAGQPTSWGSSDQMQWQHHAVHIGQGKHKQELIAKTNWQWRNEKDIAQAGLQNSIQRITAHKFVKDLLGKFLVDLEARVISNPNRTLTTLLEEVSTMRVSECFVLIYFSCIDSLPCSISELNLDLFPLDIDN